MAVVGYNLLHLQVVPKGNTTWFDVSYAISFEPTIERDSETLTADAKKAVKAWAAPEGSGSIEFGLISSTLIAVLTGGTVTTSGVTPNVITRLDLTSAPPPALSLSAWIDNVDGLQTHKGLRVSIPNATCATPSATYEQESFSNHSADIAFVPDANDVLLIYEFMETKPVFTAGVMPVNLVPPA